MDVFNFVVSQGAVIDAARYEQALRNLGVRPTELQRLRIQLADVGGHATRSTRGRWWCRLTHAASASPRSV